MFLVKRSRIISIILVLSVVAFTLCIIGVTSNSTVDNKEITVVLDAGHGGIDNGVTGRYTGAKESELNLSITKKVKNNLIKAGIKVVLTRESSNGLYGLATKNRKRKDMLKRKEIIESVNPNLVLSIHQNYYSLPSRRGAQVFFDEGKEESKSFAKKLQQSLNNMEEASRECSILKGDYYILNSHQYPSALVECGFLSNKEDENLLITEEYQEKIAYAIFKGIIDYLSTTTSYGFNV
ncbi:MAG: N-acetylmuramoyl-L-alanine amidase [Clostridiales bacterium]|nr:N-acetylmuramoyl-L-alanine amidase [Clostridiales bacterium]